VNDATEEWEIGKRGTLHPPSPMEGAELQVMEVQGSLLLSIV
jgi:hypothetical protein